MVRTVENEPDNASDSRGRTIRGTPTIDECAPRDAFTVVEYYSAVNTVSGYSILMRWTGSSMAISLTTNLIGPNPCTARLSPLSPPSPTLFRPVQKQINENIQNSPPPSHRPYPLRCLPFFFPFLHHFASTVYLFYFLNQGTIILVFR